MADDKAVLLIGGRGFIGQALARSLAARGRQVHVLSRSGQTGESDGIHYHCGSQDDPTQVGPLLEQCTTLVHLASTTTPGASARRPLLEAEDNLLPGLRLIDLLAQAPPKRLIYLSSGGALYGNVEQLPADESPMINPVSYYAAGKGALESFFAAFAHAQGVSLAIVRPSNVYGPGQGLRSGFGVIRTLMQKAQDRTPFEVWGEQDKTRDFVYIDDVVDALTRLLHDPTATGRFNLGSGVGTTIGELIEQIGRISGSRIEVVVRPARKTDVDAIVLDSARLHGATGWQATTSLPEGLTQTWHWLESGSR